MRLLPKYTVSKWIAISFIPCQCSLRLQAREHFVVQNFGIEILYWSVKGNYRRIAVLLWEIPCINKTFWWSRVLL